MDEIKKIELPFSIVLITGNNKQDEMKILENYFIHGEPLCASLEFSKEKESVVELENFCADLLKKGISFMAVSETDEVIGITINNIMCRDDLLKHYGDEKMDKISKYNEIEIFLDKVRGNSDVYGKYPNVDKIMELKIISVNETYRRQGVCKALINKSKELALKLGCQMMYAECSSSYTAKAVERFGFQCVYSFSYSDYVNKQGKVVFKTQPPHEFSRELALELGCQMMYAAECSSSFTAKAVERFGFQCVHSFPYSDHLKQTGKSGIQDTASS